MTERGTLVDVPEVAQQREMTQEEAIDNHKILSFDDDTMQDGTWQQDPDLSPFWGTITKAIMHIKEQPLEADPDLEGGSSIGASDVGELRMKLPASDISSSYWELVLNWTPEWKGCIPPGNTMVSWQDRQVAIISPWQFVRICPTCKTNLDIVTPLFARKPKPSSFCNTRCPICQQRAWKEWAIIGSGGVRPPQLMRDCAEYVARETKRDGLTKILGGDLAKHDPLEVV